MANTNDPTVKIELRTDYDNTGAREAAGDLQDLSQSAASAMQGSGASAEAEALRSKALVEMAKLEAKTRRELEAEIKRLIAARKEAAAAGDTKRYAALTDQLGRVKKAYADMRNAANLNKAALMGQANAGMQFAGTLSSLGAQLKSGKADLAGVANGVLSLGMALKAGLGPIGWAMVAIEGLAAAFDYLDSREQKALEKQQELGRIIVSTGEALQQIGAKYAEINSRQIEDQFRQQKKADEYNAKLAGDRLRRANEAADKQRSAAKDSMQEHHKMEMADMRGRVARGEATHEEVMAMLSRQGTERLELEQQNNEEAARASVKSADQSLAAAQTRQRRVENTIAAMRNDHGKLWDEAENEEIAEISDALENESNRQNEIKAHIEQLQAIKEDDTSFVDNMSKWLDNASKILLPIPRLVYEAVRENDPQKAYDAALQALNKELAGIGESVTEKETELAKALGTSADDARAKLGQWQKVRDQRRGLEEELRGANDAVEQAQHNASAARKEVQRQIANGKARKRTEDAEERARKAEEERRKREEKWARLQQGDPRQAAQYAEEMMSAMKEGSEEWQRWRDRLRTMDAAVRTEEWEAVQKQSLEAQKAWLKKKISELSASEDYKERRGYQKQLDSTEAQLRAKGYHEAQSRTLAEQLSYVQRMLEATKEGTLEWEKWRDEQKKLNNLKVHEEIEKLEKHWKVSQNYAEACSKTAAETLAADRKALFERQRRLQALLRTPDLDAKTTREINERLKETNRSISGFAASMRQGAVQAARDLQNARLPDLRAENKQFAGNLKQVQKAYIAALRRATQHAAKGNAKELKRDMASIERLTKTMEALSGYNGQAMERMQSDIGKLATVFYGFGQQGGKKKSLTESIKDEVLNGSKRRSKAARAQEKKDEDEDEQRNEQRDEKRERRKPAKAAKATKPKQVTPPAENGKELAEPLQRAASEVKDMAAAGRAMKEAVVQGADRLVQAVQGVAQEMQGVAGAVDSKFASVLSSVTDLRTQINNLKNDISR